MNKTEIKKKKGILKEYRSDILGITAFLAGVLFIFWIGSLGYYW
ncbi:MAG: hypothetical protein ACFE8G_06020 [Candidatus Hermodarchaeota archaeon]